MNTLTSVSKNGKPETILPSISQDIHTSPMLDSVVRQTIGSRQNGCGENASSPGICSTNGHDAALPLSKLFTGDEETLLNIDRAISELGDSNYSSIGSISANGYPSSSEDGQNNLKKKTKRAKSVDPEYNYNQLFSSKEELLRLVDHEGETLQLLWTHRWTFYLNCAELNNFLFQNVY